jgi:hypothetical protein
VSIAAKMSTSMSPSRLQLHLTPRNMARQATYKGLL